MKNVEKTYPSSSAENCIQNHSFLQVADIVTSINGRDAGKQFIVIGTDADYSLIANGKGRRLEKPKRKKCKHLKLESKADDLITEKLTKGDKVTNNEIRRVLAGYAAELSNEGGMQDAKR
jgi:ribosomal protein L14E/L6E/L27E